MKLKKLKKLQKGKPLPAITIDIVPSDGKEAILRVEFNEAVNGGRPTILRNIPEEEVSSALAAALLVLADAKGTPELTIKIGRTPN